LAYDRRYLFIMDVVTNSRLRLSTVLLVTWLLTFWQSHSKVVNSRN